MTVLIDSTDTLQRHYDSEINFELFSLWDGGFMWVRSRSVITLIEEIA
jgi:hypothetical protein